MMKLDEARAREVLSFWLGDEQGQYDFDPDVAARWFMKDPAFDDEIRRRFGALIEAAQAGELVEQRADAKTRLAHVILLDQLARNAFRDDPRMYAGDERALVLVEEALEAGHEQELSVMGRCFLYLPLMHSEELRDQEACLRHFRALLESLPAEVRSGPLGEHVEGSVGYAIRHLEIVERFGRFPHRNAILRRETTEEERAFLKEPNSSF